MKIEISFFVNICMYIVLLCIFGKNRIQIKFSYLILIINDFVLSMLYNAHVSNCSLLISPFLFRFVLSMPDAAHVSNCSLLGQRQNEAEQRRMNQ
jgi:K+-sensing histidine kinase KdpD